MIIITIREDPGSYEDSLAMKDVHAELEQKEAALNEKDIALMELERKLQIALSEQASKIDGRKLQWHTSHNSMLWWHVGYKSDDGVLVMSPN